MKYQLSIENSEIYRNLPRYPFHKRYKNVRNDLMQLHPGFTDESIWDFQADKKGITACVISRDFYEEKRIFHPLCRFVAMEEGKKRKMREIEFFRWPDYTKDGKRRKQKRIAFLLTVIGICAAIGCFILLQDNFFNKELEINTFVPETEDSEVILSSLSSKLEDCISVINRCEGQLFYMESSRHENTVCRFGVYGGNVSTCIKELEMMENIQEVNAENLNWIDGKWEYTISCIFSENLDSLNLKPWDNNCLICFSKGENCIIELDCQLISSIIDEGNNLVFFTFLLEDKKPDSEFLQKLEKSLYKTGCIIENLKISPFTETNRNSFIVEIAIKDVQDLASINLFPSKEMSFIWKESAEKRSDQKIEKKASDGLENIISEKESALEIDTSGDLKSSEIGRVKKGDKEVIYFRNNDGKINTKILGGVR